MSVFDWKKEYSVSVMRFDADHKKLFSLLKELHHAMTEGRERTVVVHVLQQLAAYTRTHFAAEESALRTASYAGLDEHIAEHRELTAKVEELCAEYGARHAAISLEVLYFLNEWLERHILGTDRKYSELLNRAGLD